MFAQWQPRYAERGVATFPVCGKRPAVSNYLTMGLPASRQMAAKFGDADGIGIACGKRSRITVIDVDSPDERDLVDALEQFGPTPFIVRSGSGNYQAWYRHNGERRQIRPDKTRPIDILGGGFVVAPPSRTLRGKYQLINGSLDDLPALPALRRPSEPGKLAPEVQIEGQHVREGERNNTLWRLCMKQAQRCAEFVDLMEFAMQVNKERLSPPLPDEEVVGVVRNAWEKEVQGENFFGGRRGQTLSNDQIDALIRFPDAMILLIMLRRHHWGRDFVCANAMHQTMPRNGWTRQRFASARSKLEEFGEIQMIRPPSRHGGPAIYRFKSVRNQTPIRNLPPSSLSPIKPFDA